MFKGLEIVGSGSGSCPLAGIRIVGFESPGYAPAVLILIILSRISIYVANNYGFWIR
jgi:hypothetical protein